MEIDKLLKKLEKGKHELYPPATEKDIKLTESKLDKSLPDSFKRFLTKFSNGAYVYEIQEVGAVGKGNKQIMAIQNIQTSPDLDPETKIPIHKGGNTKFKFLIPFGLDSEGNEWCFIAEKKVKGNEYPVAYLSTLNNKLYAKLDNFSSWLKILIKDKDEVIRVVYKDDEDVLYDELMIG